MLGTAERDMKERKDSRLDTKPAAWPHTLNLFHTLHGAKDFLYFGRINTLQTILRQVDLGNQRESDHDTLGHLPTPEATM